MSWRRGSILRDLLRAQPGSSAVSLSKQPRVNVYVMPTGSRVLILGAGFGGLELATMLSSADDDGALDVVLIDKGDAFVFGYSKLDVMFGRTTLDAVRLPYRAFAKRGVRLVR